MLCASSSATWGLSVRVGVHAVFDLWAGTAALQGCAITQVLNNVEFSQKVLPSAILICFVMYYASLFKRLFSNATDSLFINIRDEGVEGKAENLNTFAKTRLGVSKAHYLREVTVLSKGDLTCYFRNILQFSQ